MLHLVRLGYDHVVSGSIRYISVMLGDLFGTVTGPVHASAFINLKIKS
jgi:hypothetical protein